MSAKFLWISETFENKCVTGLLQFLGYLRFASLFSSHYYLRLIEISRSFISRIIGRAIASLNFSIHYYKNHLFVFYFTLTFDSLLSVQLLEILKSSVCVSVCVCRARASSSTFAHIGNALGLTFNVWIIILQEYFVIELVRVLGEQNLWHYWKLDTVARSAIFQTKYIYIYLSN